MEPTSLTVSLPESLKAFVERQAAAGGYGTPSDYVQALIREAQDRAAEDKLEALLLEAIESKEPPIEVTPAYWEEMRRRLMERHGKDGKP